MSAKTVLSLGQCAADNWTLSRALRAQFGVEVIAVDRLADAEARLRQGGIDLVLVNRVLDRDGSSGLDGIGRLKSDEKLRTCKSCKAVFAV